MRLRINIAIRRKKRREHGGYNSLDVRGGGGDSGLDEVGKTLWRETASKLGGKFAAGPALNRKGKHEVQAGWGTGTLSMGRNMHRKTEYRGMLSDRVKMRAGPLHRISKYNQEARRINV